MVLMLISPSCLNPCFSGNRFGRATADVQKPRVGTVLILVLVEIGLGV